MRRQRGFGWVEVIIGLAIVGVIVAGVAGIYHSGKGAGRDEQKATDQTEFDRIEAERTKQKAEAAALYRQAQADIIALQAERDNLKTELEKQREKDRKATDARRDDFAGRGLRFKPAQGAGDRGDGICTASAGGNPSGPATSATVELPGALTESLRRLAYDADRLADDYRECYGYAQKVK